MAKRSNSYNTGIASEYLILSKLYRLDLEAYVSQGNKKSIDIRVITDKDITLSIDVKSVRGYSSLIVNNIISKINHFIVFVIYNNQFNDLANNPEIFIVPSSKIKALQSNFRNGQKRIMKGKLLPYKDNWSLITNFNDTQEKKSFEEVLSNYQKVLNLRKKFPRAEVLHKLNLTEEELTSLEIAYNEITGA